MANPDGRTSPDPRLIERFIELSKEHVKHDGTPNLRKISSIMGVARGTIHGWTRSGALDAKNEAVEYPDNVLADEDEPIDDILSRLKRAHKRQQKAIEARTWFPIKIKETKPYGILWFGDPHLGQHCNWDLLERDLGIARQDGVYGGNIGDTSDNWPWTGRMAKLWAEVDVSSPTEKRLATWFMFEAGVKWLVWLLGNHDEWNGGSEFYKMLGAHQIPVLDWRAQFRLVHAKTENRIDAAHGRKGSSIYNPTHGTLREAKFGENADVYITGHTHNYGLFDIEFSEKRHRTWLAQISGYKVGGLYEAKGGFGQSQHGCSMLSVHDPETGKIQCFGDAAEGAEFLAWKRR